MITQDRLCRSPSSRPMVGRALATIVWFTAERKPPSIRPWKMRWISFLVSGATWAWLSVRSLNELIAFVFLRLYSRYFSLFLAPRLARGLQLPPSRCAQAISMHVGG